MHRFSSGHVESRHTWHGTDLRSTVWISPYGCHCSGKSLAEQSETHGVPIAAARCCTPESMHITRRERDSRAHDSISDNWPAILYAPAPIPVAISLQIAESEPPPTIATAKL